METRLNFMLNQCRLLCLVSFFDRLLALVIETCHCTKAMQTNKGIFYYHVPTLSILYLRVIA